MASKLSSATLKVKIVEDIILDGRQRGSQATVSLSGINEISKRIVTIPITEVEILAFSGTAVGSGTFLEGSVKYIRITNLDDTNHITLTFKNENNDEFAIKVDASHSFIYPGDNSGGVVDTMDAIDGAGLTLALGDLVNITALADTAACDIEFFVAST